MAGSNGNKLMHSPPYNPAVRTYNELKVNYEEKLGDEFIFLQKVLLNHHSSSGVIFPAEQLFNFKPLKSMNKNFAPVSKNDLQKFKQVTTQLG